MVKVENKADMQLPILTSVGNYLVPPKSIKEYPGVIPEDTSFDPNLIVHSQVDENATPSEE